MEGDWIMIKNDILVRFLSFFVLLKNDRKCISTNLKQLFTRYRRVLTLSVVCLSVLLLCIYIPLKMNKTILNASDYDYIEDIQEPTPVVIPEDPIREEAEYVAKVLYGTALDNSSKGKELVVWCIINRVENEKYPNTVKEVCQQKDQWMGYSDTNPVMQDLYDTAYNVLSKWHEDNYRTVSPDYIFMSWSQKSITLRTEFNDSKTCKYLYE